MAFVSSLAPVVGSAASSASSAVCERQTSMRGAPVRRAAMQSRPAPANATPTMLYGESFREALENNCNFTELIKLADHVGFDLDSMSGTFFAPDNKAFACLKPGTLEAWYAKPDVAKNILVHHLVPDQVLTLAKITGCGWFESTQGGPLGYEGLGAIIKVGGSLIQNDASNQETTTGIYHVIESILTPMNVKPAGFDAGFSPSIATFTDSTVASLYPVKPQSSTRTFEAASLPSSVGGRKAMGLMKQQPFWMYGVRATNVESLFALPTSGVCVS